MSESAYIKLLHEGSEYSLEIKDLSQTIGEFQRALIALLGLPRYDEIGNPCMYHVGRIKGDQMETFQTYPKRDEKTLAGYDIKSGDVLEMKNYLMYD